jgi:hypothetical protein
MNAPDELRTAVAAAPVGLGDPVPPPENETVGADTYPEPPLTRVIEVTSPEAASMFAVADAPVPPPPVNVTDGATV